VSSYFLIWIVPVFYNWHRLITVAIYHNCKPVASGPTERTTSNGLCRGVSKQQLSKLHRSVVLETRRHRSRFGAHCAAFLGRSKDASGWVYIGRPLVSLGRERVSRGSSDVTNSMHGRCRGPITVRAVNIEKKNKSPIQQRNRNSTIRVSPVFFRSHFNPTHCRVDLILPRVMLVLRSIREFFLRDCHAARQSASVSRAFPPP